MKQVQIHLLPTGVQLQVAEGVRLLDALDEAERMAFPVACRAANCGCCRLRVVQGAEALQPAAARERATLTQLAAADDERLGCQIMLAVTGDEYNDELVVILDAAGRRR